MNTLHQWLLAEELFISLHCQAGKLAVGAHLPSRILVAYSYLGASQKEGCLYGVRSCSPDCSSRYFAEKLRCRCCFHRSLRLPHCLRFLPSRQSPHPQQVVSGLLSTAWRAITNLSATAFSMTGAASVLLILNCIACSVTWNSSSTSDAKMFQSARNLLLISILDGENNLSVARNGIGGFRRC